MSMSNSIQYATIQNTSAIKRDLNFRLRLDIGGANIRIEDKLVKTDSGFWIDPECGLDMDFDIEKSWDETPNKSTITIYNITNDTYNRIYENANAFELYGAMGDDEYSLMFRGYPDKQLKRAKQTLITSNEGFMKQDYRASFAGQNDLPTVLELLDFGGGVINKYYPNTISSKVVFDDVIASMDLKKGNIASDIQFKPLKNFTARGKSAAIMNYLAQLNGFQWTVMNGLFEAYTGEVPDQPYGILLDSYNSSTPERQDDKFQTKQEVLQKANKKKGVQAKKKIEILKTEKGYMIETQLLPFLNPGVFAYCDFGILQGTKFIYKVKHVGNNYGVNCSTKVWVV